MPSRLAPYPARPVENIENLQTQTEVEHIPKLPIVQTAGHKPATLFMPGRDTDVTIKPPVKQNLFHVDSNPPS
jgi:hypothetical protein